MDIRSLSKGMKYLGKVEGQRQVYHVFEAPEQFFVCSFSRLKANSGNFNLVDREVVDYARRLVSGQRRVTANDLRQKSRKPEYIGKEGMAALNALYVLVALGDAKIDRRLSLNNRQLFFNVPKHPSRA